VACGARTELLSPEERDASDVVTDDVRDVMEEDVRDAREEDATEEDVIEEDASQCPTEATLIYVTGSGGALYSFWPPSFTFTLIGNLTCTSNPTHMTVDRNGVAWVVADGLIYNASTTDASCTAVSNWMPQTGFEDFALSFVGLTKTDTSLYVYGESSADLALFDTKTGSFTIVGSPGLVSSGDMTSNGDGTLYYLYDTSTPLHLYELSPLNASVLNTYTLGATGGGSQALAYFGGSFYAFEDNVVYAYDAVADTTMQLGSAPLEVTGAGQSTCVPNTPTDAGAPD
jgi:hypothetical protein